MAGSTTWLGVLVRPNADSAPFGGRSALQIQ